MKKALLFSTLITAAIASQTASAQGFLDRINDVVSKVDQTLTTGERAQQSAERVMDKMPERPEAQEETQAEEQPETIEPASGASYEIEAEEEILRKAREIEERRILERAEDIKRQRAAGQGNQ